MTSTIETAAKTYFKQMRINYVAQKKAAAGASGKENIKITKQLDLIRNNKFDVSLKFDISTNHLILFLQAKLKGL